MSEEVEVEDVESKPNGKAILGDHLPLDETRNPRWHRWPEIEQAAKTMRLSVRQLYNLCNEGRLTRYLASDGTLRFDPNELKAKAKEARLVKASGRKTDDLEVDFPEVEAGAITEITASNLARQAMVHSERLFQLTLEPLKLAHDTLQNENAALRKQVDKYQERQLEFFQKLEELTSLKQERDLRARAAEVAEKRKDELLTLLLEVGGPVIVKKVGQWLGEKDEKDERDEKDEPSNQPTESTPIEKES